MNDYQSLINWFPGHMAKAKRLLSDQLKRVDLIIELCDARLPYSSRNPELAGLFRNKKHLLFLNKSDLADPAATANWIRYFRSEGITAGHYNALAMRRNDAIQIIENTTRDMVERALQKGMRKTVRAMVVGVPNVGKSTFINRLFGKSIAQIGDRPGVTKNNQWVKISSYLELLDTPGLLWPRLEDQTAARRLCYIGSIKDDVVDLADLTIHLLEDLRSVIPDNVDERFHISDSSCSGNEILDAVCRGRGWLLKGGLPDYDRCCRVVLDEFRAGKLGRITLELPEQYTAGEGKQDG